MIKNSICILLLIPLMSCSTVGTMNVRNNHYYTNSGFLHHKNEVLSSIKNFTDILISPNEIYKAVLEGNQEYLVIFKNEKEYFRFKWDEVCSIFTWSDTIRILGWSNNNHLWFMSWTPTNIAYIAEIDLNLKKCIFYDSPRLDEPIYYYDMDCDNGIFKYSNKIPIFDPDLEAESDSQKITNYIYNLYKGEIYEDLN